MKPVEATRPSPLDCYADAPSRCRRSYGLVEGDLVEILCEARELQERLFAMVR